MTVLTNKGNTMTSRENSLKTHPLLKTLILIGFLMISGPDVARAEQESKIQNPSRQPYAYLFLKRFGRLTNRLQRNDIEVCELREDIELDIEAYRITDIVRDETTTDRPPSFRFVTQSRQDTRRFRTGTILVKVRQKSANIIEEMLDPNSQKPAGIRRFFRRFQIGDDYPVVKLNSYVPITHGAVRPLREQRQLDRPITFKTIYDPNERVDFGGSPVSVMTWLEDGEHYLQVRDRRLYKVHAASGRSHVLFDPNALAEGLKTLPTMDEKTADSLSKRTRLTMNPARNAVLIDHENDLYYCTLDGTTAVRLTSSPEQEELSSFGPNGTFVAFVRNQNLYVVDIATQTERALTIDGGGLISNGRADWVYYEELFGRRRQAYWWSPDASAIAFMQFDDAPVREFSVVHHTGKNQQVERTAYPRPGEPNPNVKIGVVSAAGGMVRWIELDRYLEGAYLIPRVGWMPDGEEIFFFVQDRAQTWLDFNTASKRGGTTRHLLRETTEAWVDVPDDPTFLSDGSFLLLSERTGWKHIYLYDQSGHLKRELTGGEWEARRLNHVDEEKGWIYFTGTRDSHIAENLYRVRLRGGRIRRLTNAGGSHRVNISSNGRYFIDTWSNSTTPTRVKLCNMAGRTIRMLDTNPVYVRQEYRFGDYEQFQIETSDGFLLEASLIKPPDFNSRNKYPVWFTTYGGPHAPRIRDAWSSGRARDQMLAQMGILVFQCDPRSASGKGACSTWTAYKQLGVQELKDITDAIEWLKSHPFVDGDRIGMSGHSYGGFMTAYAMTHSQLFAGGIAGAPVTDWRLYDTVYTERYMDIPQNNPDGYATTSVIEAAQNLHGRLLIIHGAIDDNVHIENTYKFVQALQQADKDFDLMIYPSSRHGVGGAHYNRFTVDFIQSVLRLDP